MTQRVRPHDGTHVFQVSLLVGTIVIFVVAFAAVARFNPVFGAQPVLAPATSTPTSRPTQTATPTTSPTPTARPTRTLTPFCSPSGEPIKLEDISIFFDTDVRGSVCDLFPTYVKKYNVWMKSMGYETGEISVFAYKDVKKLVDLQYDWIKAHGCNPDSKETILAGWMSHWPSPGGNGSYGAAFYMVDGWKPQDVGLQVSSLIHEMVQATQMNYVGGCPKYWQMPDWFKSGYAEHLASRMEQEWGITQLDSWENMLLCDYALSELAPPNYCVYDESEQAFVLLEHMNPTKEGFDVGICIRDGGKFTSCFKKVYGMTLEEFYREFDAFRASGYILPATPSATPTP